MWLRFQVLYLYIHVPLYLIPIPLDHTPTQLLPSPYTRVLGKVPTCQLICVYISKHILCKPIHCFTHSFLDHTSTPWPEVMGDKQNIIEITHWSHTLKYSLKYSFHVCYTKSDSHKQDSWNNYMYLGDYTCISLCIVKPTQSCTHIYTFWSSQSV